MLVDWTPLYEQFADPRLDEGGVSFEPGAADVLTPEDAAELLRQRNNNPSATADRIRQVVDAGLSDEDIEAMYAVLERAFVDPDGAASFAQEGLAFDLGRTELPAGFEFPGMDPAIAIQPASTTFETRRDVMGWIINSGPLWLLTRIHQNRHDFRWADTFPSRFIYPMRSDGVLTEMALLSDFGTGLYHSRYIAKHIADVAAGVHHVAHLGDVYYAGKQSEFEKRFEPILAPIVAKTELYTLNSNHEMMSGGGPYFRYLDGKRAKAGAVAQPQEGSYFCLVSDAFQVIGIDTAYHRDGRYAEPRLGRWLTERLEEGRRGHKINILLSADEPYSLGTARATALLRTDLVAVANRELIDLWFWGNTHYCALFGRSDPFRFIGTCIGHGGYPYGCQKDSQRDDGPTAVRFLESEPRFPRATLVRQDRGNNGFVFMTLDHRARTVMLRYVDWMRSVRHTARLEIRNGHLDFAD